VTKDSTIDAAKRHEIKEASTHSIRTLSHSLRPGHGVRGNASPPRLRETRPRSTVSEPSRAHGSAHRCCQADALAGVADRSSSLSVASRADSRHGVSRPSFCEPTRTVTASALPTLPPLPHRTADPRSARGGKPWSRLKSPPFLAQPEGTMSLQTGDRLPGLERL
jgi:hypothetical protein